MLASDWRVIVRRWYVLMAGLVVTTALCFAAGAVVAERYQMSSNVLLLPPRSVVDGRVTNPYIALGGLDGMSDVLSTAMSDASVEDDIPGEGADVTFELARDVTVAGPVLLLEVEAASPELAEDTLAHLLEVIPRRLSDLQANVGVAEGDRVTSTVITRETVPTIDRKSQIRALLVTLVGGLGFTYLSAAFIDSMLVRRRSAAVIGSGPGLRGFSSVAPLLSDDEVRAGGRDGID